MRTIPERLIWVMPLDLPGLVRAGAWGMTGIEVDDAGKVIREMPMVDLTEAELLELVPRFDLGMSQRHQAALTKQVDDAKVASDKMTADHKVATDKLTTDLATAKSDLVTAATERNSAKQEVADIYNLLGADPKIAAIKKQQAIAEAEKAIADAVRRKEDLVNPKAVTAEEILRNL